MPLRPADQTAALDDLLTSRLVRCTTCGKQPVMFEGLWLCSDEEVGRSVALTYGLCHHCITNDPQRKVLDAKLRARYGFEEDAADASRR